MFDIGFSEIIVCAVVALIVIGPERMPEAVRTIGLWIGRLKRSMHETRQEIERQIGVEDIRRQLHNEDIMRSLEKTRNEINNELNTVIEHVKADIDAEERSKLRTYSNEQELPDHAHTTEHSLAQDTQQTKNPEHTEPVNTNITTDSKSHAPAENPKTPL